MAAVTDAVILAGGRGTRMLPASLYMPKEALPLVDTPILNHLIWEADRAGVRRIHVVLSASKKELLAGRLEQPGALYEDDVRPDLPRGAFTIASDGVEVLVHVQMSPGGVADAIATALPHINGPFLVLLGDTLLMDSHPSPQQSGPEFASNACAELSERYSKTGLPSAGVVAVPNSALSKYGVVELEGDMISSIVEKPRPEDAPSNYVLCGRYLLPKNTDELIGMHPTGTYGELQSIALFNYLIEHGGFEAVRLENYSFYDSGDPLTWLKSQVDHALLRDDVGGDFLNWVNARMN